MVRNDAQMIMLRKRMETLLRNKWSSVGMLLGAIAFMLVAVHFTFGPFQHRPSIEQVVAEQVAAVKKGVLAGLKGENVQSSTSKASKMDIDGLLTITDVVLAAIALLLAAFGGMRKESRWSVYGTLFFAGATLTFHAIVAGMALVSALVFLVIVLAVVSLVLS